MLPKEKDLEILIEDYLVSAGYEQGSSTEFNIENSLFTQDLFKFIENTQKELLDQFKANRGTSYKKAFIDLINREIKTKGLIHVLRNGVEDIMMNGKFELFYNRPNLTNNKTAYNNYKQNIFKVTRQLKYSSKHNNTLDMVISLNGFPIITMELKNQFTGQNVHHAINQFKQDRDPNESLFEFNKRILVYFAVDNDEVYMTTKLNKEKTYFLPFNKGNNKGKGNPIIDNKKKTSYLWEDILKQDSILDIVKRFYYIQENKNKTKVAIFPRFHQLDAVRKIVKDISIEKEGLNYLIQHSAGSGKTNTIAWTAHRLSSLHDDNNESIFDSIIVVTDRKVLDKQLQDAIYQLEHRNGLVVKIDDDKTSSDLADAIVNRSKIIITTIQKFQYALPKIESLDKRKYAIIIDEAHSSTSGENMNALKEVLAEKTLEEAKEIDLELEQKEKTSLDKMNEILEKRTNLGHISFIAFTATPKNKTMQVFGRIGDDGKPHEFHLYSMKQAIEEGFILDVLKNFMPVNVYYKVRKKIEDNPEFDKGEAKRAINKYVSLNEYNIRKKVETIVDDFMENRVMWIDNNAKGMIVTASRLHALRYKLMVDEYIKEKGYNIKTLVAFSGVVKDGDDEYTEVSMNKAYSSDITENNLPTIFDRNEFKLLIVADKYQTGFDQPKLCAMYIDKKLDGVKTVQTLSRLNRTYADKKTFILDFQNSTEDIQNAYKPYFETTQIDNVTDPNVVNDLLYQLHEYGIYHKEEIDEFVELFYKEKRTHSQNSMMDNIMDKGVERYCYLEEEDEKCADEFKKKCQKYITFYNFLIQIYPIKNANLLRLHIYLVSLLKKLPRKHKDRIDLDEMLALDYYKLQKLSSDNVKGSDISLYEGEGELVGISENAVSRVSNADDEYFDDIIKKINDVFGIGLVESDKIMIDTNEEMFKQDEKVINTAQNNTLEDFIEIFKKSYFKRGIVKTKKINDRFAKEVLTNENLQNYMIHYLAQKIYSEVNQ